MKISIITVVYNGVNVLERTLQSVLAQRNVNLEYIVIDGGSTDGTIQLLEHYTHRLSGWASEPDHGIYDAMNKGLHRATGEIIGFLNADDVYQHNQALNVIVEQFETPAVQAAYGDLVYVDNNDQPMRYWRTGPFSSNFFAQGYAPPHPSFFVRRDVLLQVGGFCSELKLAADYELMFRILKSQKCAVRYLPEILVRMRASGASNHNWRSILRGLNEISTAWRMNGQQPPPALWLLIMYRRLRQRWTAQQVVSK